MSDFSVAILLGALQGLTEFLPVSSSGHLAILQGIIGERWTGDVLFDVSLHLGTVLSVLVYFRTDIITLLKGILPGSFNRKDATIVLCILLTTAVTGIVGLPIHHPVESLFGYPKVVAAMLLITGCLTFLTYRMGSRTKTHALIRPRDAFVIGLFQAVALIPGISRSGSTIFAGVLCGLERTFAASYSFIASIPAIMGAAAVEWGTNSHHVSSLHLVGGATAFIVGLISLRFLVWTLKRNTFFIFSLYCWLVGFVYLAFF
ncbi:MAG: undecaprenyl-diphosphate phosphatase [Syntrophaceae bacterium]|nr:undecaprenyl-diphosphate phosphatase [Deltaproteobacteria bacterium]